jgi:hypothetical protein
MTDCVRCGKESEVAIYNDHAGFDNFMACVAFCGSCKDDFEKWCAKTPSATNE